jgi:hypothetical protein
MNENLEDQIRGALRRQDPPEGFAERIVHQAESARAERREALQPGLRRLWPAATLAATSVLVLSVSIEYRAVRQERIQEERAGRQAIQALRIASEKLNTARNKILNNNVLNKE